MLSNSLYGNLKIFCKPNACRKLLHQSYRTLFSIDGVWPKKLDKATILEVEDYWNKQLNAVDKNIAKKYAGREKCYILSMFPYPSGKLHLGHVRVYTISDVLARFNRMLGKDVIHPIGWDSFGLPAENAARDRGLDPKTWTYENIDYMKQQLKSLGCSFDWDREFATSDPTYYTWTQYLFLQMFESGIAYQKLAMVNWDPVDETVLANEQVNVDGTSWRSGAEVEKRLLKQWFLKSTKYSKALFDGLSDSLLKDWQEVTGLQKAWIGECNGWNFDFKLELNGKPQDDWLTLWTDSPELLHGAAFVAVSSDHYLLAIDEMNSSLKLQETILKVAAVNPFTGERLPIVATSRINFPAHVTSHIGIPAKSEEDLELCKRLEIPYQTVIANKDGNVHLINSGKFTGMNFEAARTALCEHAKNGGFGGYPASAKLHDWLISRQRYWGTPIPIIHCPNCKVVPVPYKDLPVLLPENEAIFSAKGISPLQHASKWVNVKCPKCGADSKRETDTMDTFVDSSWYYLRYLEPHNSDMPFTKEVANKYMPVDVYVGGQEHACLHLYMSRFVMHFLHEKGLVNHREAFQRLLMLGQIRAKTFMDKKTGRYLSEDQVKQEGTNWFNGETGSLVTMTWDKMSKSKHNGVDPQKLFDVHGADITRIFLLNNSNPVETRDWSEDDIIGALNWQWKLWFLINEFLSLGTPAAGVIDIEKHETNAKHYRNTAVSKVTFALRETFALNVAITALIKYTGEIKKLPKGIMGSSLEYEKALETLLLLLAPFMPRYASELWTGFVHSPVLHYPRSKCVLEQPWPNVDLDFNLKIDIQLNDLHFASVYLSREKFDALSEAEIVALAEAKVTDELTKRKCYDVQCTRVFGCGAKVMFSVYDGRGLKTKLQKRVFKEKSRLYSD